MDFFFYRFRRTTLLLMFCLSFLVAVGVARLGWGLRAPPFLTGLIGIAAALAAWRAPVARLVAAVLFGALLGSWRGDVYVQKLTAYEPLYGNKVSLEITANEDAVYGKKSQITFVAVDIFDPQSGQKLPGKLSVSGFGMNSIFQGDRLQLDGKLARGLGGYQGFVSYGQFTLLHHKPSWIADVRRRFAAGMQTALPEPLASFAMGLLIGQRATLPPEIKQDLLMVGLTHVIAVSGYNLTIMLQASRKLLADKSKRLSFALSFSLMALFVLLAGLSASIFRAAIVSGLSMVTQFYGRSMRPELLISMAATITVWINPLYIWGDPSWYLSFLAFYGVMVVGPLLQARLPTRLENSVIVGVFLESLSAEIMTLPFVLAMFGQMSLVNLPANVLVVALVPLAMLLSTIAGLLGMFAPMMAGWLSWPAAWLLTYMLDTAHLLSGIPGIFRQNVWLSAAQMWGMYGLIGCMTWLLSRKSAKITPYERTQQMVNH